MSKYMPQIRFSTEFQGDTVSATMNPLTRAAFIGLLPRLNAGDLPDNDTARRTRAYEVACDVLGTHLEKIEGLRDTNGNAVALVDVLDKVFFVPLVLELFNHLIEAASLGKVTSADSAAK